MLNRLQVRNYVLIDSLEIEFPEGLIIITGQTGAGKSILLGALSVLLGESKVDISILKDKTKNCVIEAQFDEHIIRRVIAPSGRSRIFVDDEPVGVAELKSIGRTLVDIHSQNSQLLLNDESFQMAVLDHYAGNGELLEMMSQAFNEYTESLRQFKALEESISEQEKSRDYIEYQISKLEDAHLVAGELVELEEEQMVLANASLIKENLSLAHYTLQSESRSIESDIKETISILSKVSGYIGDIDSLIERLDSCRIEIKDIAQDIEYRAERVNISPERLDLVESRIALIYDLMHKHSLSSDNELIELLVSLKEQYSALEDHKEQLVHLREKIQIFKNECERISALLHERRVECAVSMSEELVSQIRWLEIPNAIFETRVERRDSFGRYGADSVKFYFSANGASGIKELTKCASGGEMSRIMLSIKALLARYAKMPTMIFDEIDTGVSGSVADKMGEMIVNLGKSMQVIAITHLPQVACKGDAHLKIYKEFDGGSATSHIQILDNDGRVAEIARMLSGSKMSPEAIANAKVLLEGKI